MIQIKNAKELDGMRKANALSAAALKYGGEHIEAGMTTWELDKLIYDFIVKHGGTPNFKGLYGFPGTACISLNDTIIHGIPSHDIVIRPGDIVSIDTGAKIDGFNGDNACTYAVGKIDLEAQRLLDVTKAALYKGIEAAKAGNRIGDIGYAVQSYCEDAGFSVVREFVGHGTGKELHEDPGSAQLRPSGPRPAPGARHDHCHRAHDLPVRLQDQAAFRRLDGQDQGRRPGCAFRALECDPEGPHRDHDPLLG